MAVARKLNIVSVTADNDIITGLAGCIKNIVMIAGTSTPSAQIKYTNTSGTILWESGTLADNARINDSVDLRVTHTDTLHFDLAGTGTKLYLYME